MAENELFKNSKYHSKLQQTFRILFVNNQAPHDDTLLEKFSSLLELQLLNETNNSDSIVDAINAVPWLTTLFHNWKSTDPSVVAFGLNVISILSQKHLLKCDRQELAEFIGDLTEQFVQLNALLRCSTLQMLHKLSNTDNVTALPSGMFDLALKGLKDDSIFVSRAAKDFLMHLLNNSFSASSPEPSFSPHDATQTDSGTSCIKKVTNYLIDCCKTAEHNLKSKGQAIAVINLFSDICAHSPEIMSKLKFAHRLQLLILQLIESVDDDSICTCCCNLLFLLAQWNFQNGTPADWVTVIEILLRKQQYICIVTFAIYTIERLSANQIAIPQAIKSIILTPLVLLSRWQSNEGGTWKDTLPIWSSAVSALHTDNRISLFSKLNCCIVSNLQKTLCCFQSSTEKFELVNILMHVLIAYCMYAFFPTKLQSATVDALLGVLEVWGNDWYQGLSESNQSRLLDDSIGILESQVSPIPIMVKTMKSVQMIFRSCQNCLLSNWMSVEKELTAIIEKLCHNLHWEIRDSAYEMLAEIAKIAKEHIPIQNWLKESSLLSLTILALDDTEGYVRASALHVLENNPELYHDQVSCFFKNDIATEPTETVLRILLQDSEGIARRAAAATLLSWYKDSRIREHLLDAFFRSMVIASMDLDWEVKLTTIKFWNLLITETISKGSVATFGSCPNSPLANVEFLEKAGFCSAAVSLAKDEDVTVLRKIGETLKSLKSSLPAKFASAEAFTNDHSTSQTNSGASCELSIEEAAMDTLINENEKLVNIEHVLDTRDSTYVEGIMIHSDAYRHNVNVAKTDLSELLSQHHHNRNKVALAEFVKWLENLDVDELIQQSKSSTDLYSANPMSLLDDILLDHYESDNEEGNAMDCY